MTIVAIDPGPTQSAWVLYSGGDEGGVVWNHGKQDNDVVLSMVEQLPRGSLVVIEQIESFGMAVGREVFETVFWSGRFAQACPATVAWHRLPRKAVKLHLCETLRAKDTNIRQALVDRFGGETAIGRKATPGPLYGIRADEWSALALAVTWHDLRTQPPMKAVS